MDDLADLIEQAKADVQEQESLAASADARVAAAQAESAAAREGLKEARSVLAWLLRRSQPQPVASPTANRDGQAESQPQMRFGKPVPDGDTKLKKLLDALEDLGGAASNKQISSRTDMKPDHVRGLLKYAAGKEHPPVVTEPGSGVWRLTRSLNGAGGAQ
jgi:hypothetical protein